MKFAGFWVRAWARLIDITILFPVILLLNWLAGEAQTVAAFVIPGEGLLFYLYNLCFLAKGGQTPGKRLAGFKVIRLNGSEVGWKTAFLRSLDDLIETVPWEVANALAIFSVPPAVYEAMTLYERNKLLANARPDWAHYLQIVIGVWLVLEIALVLFTSKKRAAHDFIGGTIVIRYKAVQ